MIYPNPSVGELNVEYVLSEDLKTSQKVEAKSETAILSLLENGFRVELYDKNQKMVKTGNSIQGKTKMDTNDLKPGNYYLHIYFGKEVLTRQILVK